MHGSNQLQVDDACRHAERLIACGDVHSNTDKMIFHNKLQVTDFSHSVLKKRIPLKTSHQLLNSKCMFYLQSM